MKKLLFMLLPVMAFAQQPSVDFLIEECNAEEGKFNLTMIKSRTTDHVNGDIYNCLDTVQIMNTIYIGLNEAFADHGKKQAQAISAKMAAQIFERKFNALGAGDFTTFQRNKFLKSFNGKWVFSKNLGETKNLEISSDTVYVGGKYTALITALQSVNNFEVTSTGKDLDMKIGTALNFWGFGNGTFIANDPEGNYYIISRTE